DSAGHASSRTGKLINLYCDRRDPCEHHSGKPSSQTNQNGSHKRVAEPNGKSTYEPGSHNIGDADDHQTGRAHGVSSGDSSTNQSGPATSLLTESMTHN